MTSDTTCEWKLTLNEPDTYAAYDDDGIWMCGIEEIDVLAPDGWVVYSPEYFEFSELLHEVNDFYEGHASAIDAYYGRKEFDEICHYGSLFSWLCEVARMMFYTYVPDVDGQFQTKKEAEGRLKELMNLVSGKLA